jgi:large subunit ribosomal protein L4
MKAKALYTVLSKKLLDGEVMFVDNFSFSEPKTKIAKEVVSKLGGIKGFEGVANKRKNAAYIGLGDANVFAVKSFRNFGNFKVDNAKNLNPVDLLNYKYLILTKPEDTVKFLEAKMGK